MFAFYVMMVPVVEGWGFPPLFAGLLSIPFLLVPIMLGYLSWDAHRRTGSYHIRGAVSYTRTLPPARMALWVVGLILVGGVAFTVTDAVVGRRLVAELALWLPAWYLAPTELDHIAAMPTMQLVVFLGALVFFAGLVAPVIEELYFRGNLLPGLARFGIWAPLITTVLFTFYHLESLWESPARFAMVLPMVYAVWYTRSVRLGIYVHVALNVLSALAVIVAVMAMR